MPRAKAVSLGDESKSLILDLLGQLSLQRKAAGEGSPPTKEAVSEDPSPGKSEKTSRRRKKGSTEEARAVRNELSEWMDTDDEDEDEGEAAGGGARAEARGGAKPAGEMSVDDVVMMEDVEAESDGQAAFGFEYSSCFADMANILSGAAEREEGEEEVGGGGGDDDEEDTGEEDGDDEDEEDEEEEEEGRRGGGAVEEAKMGKHDLKKLLKGLVKEEREGFAAKQQQEREEQVMRALQQQEAGGGGAKKAAAGGKLGKVLKKVRLSLCTSKRKGERKLVVVDRKKVRRTRGGTQRGVCGMGGLTVGGLWVWWWKDIEGLLKVAKAKLGIKKPRSAMLLDTGRDQDLQAACLTLH